MADGMRESPFVIETLALAEKQTKPRVTGDSGRGGRILSGRITFCGITEDGTKPE
jgi:hypothetical protein